MTLLTSMAWAKSKNESICASVGSGELAFAFPMIVRRCFTPICLQRLTNCVFDVVKIFLHPLLPSMLALETLIPTKVLGIAQPGAVALMVRVIGSIAKAVAHSKQPAQSTDRKADSPLPTAPIEFPKGIEATR